MVFNLSDLGITPAFSQDPAESTYATAWSTVFNETLISSWAMFESTFSGPLYIINAFAAFDAIAGERLNTTDAYLPNGLLAGLDSDDFVYREGEHPTTRAHHMLAGIAATSIASVPEPAVLTFLGAAIVVLAGLGRQKLFKR